MRHPEDFVGSKSNIPLSVENMDMESARQECKVSSCAKSAVTDLAGRDLCLDHFLTSCYECLDKLEPIVGRPSLEGPESLAVSAFLEDCSKRALLICLRHEYLSNLERSRLLNILLQAGHLQLQLRKPAIMHAGSVPDLTAIFVGEIPRKTASAEEQKNN